jgi:serine/threonine-protein kinase
VAAGPDALTYRARKFIERNRRALAVAAGALLVSIAALLSAWHQAQLGRLEAEKRQAVAEFMLGLFEQADLMQAGTNLRVTDLLGSAAHPAGESLQDEPETLAALLTLIASGQTELTNYEASRQLLDEVEALIEAGELPPRIEGDYLLQRAKYVHELGDLGSAAGIAGEAAAVFRKLPEAESDYLLAAATQAAYLVDAERYEYALTLTSRLVGASTGAGSAALTEIFHRHAVALEVNGDIQSAYEAYDKALELQAAYQPDNPLGRAAILSDYGVTHYFAGNFDHSEALLREVLAIYSEEFVPPHPRISSALHNLAFSMVGQERLPEAAEMLQQAYDMSVALHGEEHIDSLLEQATLAALMMKIGKFERAEHMLRANRETLARVAPEMRVQRGAVQSYLGDVLLQTGRLADSREEYVRAAELFSALPGDNIRDIEVRERLA